ncbi:MAG: hypothetical protein ABIH23_33505 [bacterium]
MVTSFSTIALSGDPVDILDPQGIKIGLTKIEVSQMIGKPLMENTTKEITEDSTVGRSVNTKKGTKVYSREKEEGTSVTVTIEEWFYEITDRMGDVWLCNFRFRDNVLFEVLAKEKVDDRSIRDTKWIRLRFP